MHCMQVCIHLCGSSCWMPLSFAEPAVILMCLKWHRCHRAFSHSAPGPSPWKPSQWRSSEFCGPACCGSAQAHHEGLRYMRARALGEGPFMATLVKKMVFDNENVFRVLKPDLSKLRSSLACCVLDRADGAIVSISRTIRKLLDRTSRVS